MGFDSVAQRPARMSIANVLTGDSIEVQYNPTEIEEALGAVYQKKISPGLSHTVKQFIHTEDLAISFDVNFDALTNPRSYTADDAMRARRFLHSLLYPRAGGTTVAEGAPPRALLIVPNLYTLTTVIVKCRVRFTRFFPTGQPSAFTASLSIEEIRDFRITSEEVLADGTQRADSGGGETLELD